MRKQSSEHGFTWVDATPVYSEVARETAKKFDPNEQLKVLTLQVDALCQALGVEKLPAFVALLEQREAIMADHQARKAHAVPD